MKTTPRSERSLAGPSDPAVSANPMTSAAASTGANAAIPGNGVAEVYMTAMATSPTRPPQLEDRGGGASDALTRTQLGEGEQAADASSQARVGSEKNAHGCDRACRTTQKTMDRSGRG